MLPFLSSDAFSPSCPPSWCTDNEPKIPLERTTKQKHITRDTELPRFSVEATGSHGSLDSTPDLFDSLTISPSLLGILAITVCVDANIQYTSTPSLDAIGKKLAAPANVDTQGMVEELGRLTPLVTLELPGLAGREDGDNAVPVVGLEVIRRLDENETQRAGGFDGWHEAVDVEDVESG